MTWQQQICRLLLVISPVMFSQSSWGQAAYIDLGDPWECPAQTGFWFSNESGSYLKCKDERDDGPCNGQGQNGETTGDANAGCCGGSADGEKKECDGCRDPEAGGGSGTNGEDPAQSSTEAGKHGPDKERCCEQNPNGMPLWSVEEPLLSVRLVDVPMWYQPSFGPKVAWKLHYKSREGVFGYADTRQANVFGLGPGWSTPWRSYIRVKFNSSPTMLWVVDGVGNVRDYRLTSNSDEPSYHPKTGAFITTWVGPSSEPGYVLNYNNGAKDIFGVEVENASEGSGQGEKVYFLSRREDAIGRGLDFYYSGTDQVGGIDQFRLTHLVDAAGSTNTLSYTNVGPMRSLIHKVTNPYGFTAIMTYDANGRLDTLIDTISLTSRIVYDGSDRVTSVKTPYGTNRFEYLSLSDTNCLAVRVIEKELRKHLFVFGDLPVDPWPSIGDVIGSLTNYVQAATNIAGINNVFFYDRIDDLKGRDPTATTNHPSARCSGYWGPLQYKNLPTAIKNSLDSGMFTIGSLVVTNYNLAHMKRWRRAVGGFVSSTKSFERYPGGKVDGTEAGPFVFFNYDVDGVSHTGSSKEGVDNLPAQVFKQTFLTDPTDSNLKVWDLRQIEYYGTIGQTRSGLTKQEIRLHRPDFPEPAGGPPQICLLRRKWHRPALPGCGTDCNHLAALATQEDLVYECMGVTEFVTNYLAHIVYPGGQYDSIIILPWDPGAGGFGIAGAPIYYEYDSGNKELSKVTYEGVAEKVRTFNGAGQLATESFQQTTGAGVVTLWTRSWTYLNGFVRTYTDERGLQVTYDTDPMGRVTKITYPDSTYVSNRFDRLDLAETIDRNGFSTKYGYNSYRQPLFITNAVNKWFGYSYCDCGSLESSTDGNGQTTTYSYDNRGRRTQTTYAGGGSWVLTKHDEWSHATNITTSGGVEQRIVHDLDGRVREKWFNDSGTWKSILANVYDVHGDLITTTNASGVAFSFEYDPYDRVLKTVFADGTYETKTYTTNGIATSVDALGNSTTYSYDQWGRLQSVTSPLNQKISVARSAAGDITYLTNESLNITQWVYDQYGRAIRKLDHTSKTNFIYGYDPGGRLISQKVPPISGSAFLETTFTYDRVGNVTNIVYPTVSQNISLAYDGNNRLTTMKDAIGTTTWSYTAFGALAGEDGPWQDDAVNYAYGADRRLQSLSVVQPGGASWDQTFVYDALGRIDKILNPVGTFDYEWTGISSGAWAGNLIKKIDLPFGNVRTNSYDSMGRMITTAAKSGSTVLDSYNYVFTNASRIIRLNRSASEFSKSNHLDFTYDAQGQLITASGVEDTTPSSTLRVHEQLGYKYDPAGNLIQRTNGTGASNQLLETFTPDSLNQLTSVARNNAFTAAGRASPNATSVTVEHGGSAPAATRYADGSFARQGITLSNGNNGFVAIATDSLSPARSATNTVTVSLPTSVTLSYDSRGNLSNDGKRRFVYNDRDEMIEVYETNKWRSVFTYDGLRRLRLRKEYTWTTTWSLTGEVRYVYSGMLAVQERSAQNLPLVTYTRGLDISRSGSGAGGIGGLLARYDHTAVRGTLYHCDLGGNVTALFSSNLVWARYSYDPYGNTLGCIGPMAELNRYRFSSKELLANSGLLYYGYRFYDPNLQRWPNRDPIQESGGLNQYGFAGGAPTAYVDSDGRYLSSIATGTASSIATGTAVSYTPGFLLGTPPGVAAALMAATFAEGYMLGYAVGDSLGWHDKIANQLGKPDPGSDPLPLPSGMQQNKDREKRKRPFTCYHYSEALLPPGEGLRVGTGVTSVGDFNRSEAMFNLGINPPNYVYTVTLPSSYPWLLPDRGLPNKQIPAWEVVIPTPPGSVGPPRPVLP